MAWRKSLLIISQRTYQKEIQQYLFDDEQTPFATMREHMKRFTVIALAQPGIARFTWDINHDVISIDGNPLRWNDILDSWQTCLGNLEASMHKVFRGCEYDHILEFIDSRLSPDSGAPGMWFRDSRTTESGYSIISEEKNDLNKFRPVLLEHLAKDKSLFVTISGVLFAKEGEIWEWFAHVQDAVDLLWYLLVTTSPGSARGTEWCNTYYANHSSHAKNLHCLNGMPCFEFLYGKMQSQTGHNNKAVLRTPAFQVMRYLLLLLTTVYYAAAHIGVFIGMEKEVADAYLYQIFVRYGHPMTSDNFTKVMQNMTRTTLNLQLGLRDYRQLDKTLLTIKCKLSMDEPDDEAEEDMALHTMHGHTVDIGRTQYGLQTTNATEKLAQDQVSFMQRIAVSWHWHIHFIHPHHKKLVGSSLVGLLSSMSAPDN